MGFHLHQPINVSVKGSINTVNGGKVGTIKNKQENSPLRRTPRKINRVIYAENSNKVNNISKRTYEEVSDEDSEVNDDEIDDDDGDDNEDDCEDDDENDYEDDDENEDEDVDEDDDENKGEDDNKDKKAKERKKLEKKLIDDFISRFKAINADDKWNLPSGRFVEDEVMDLFSPEEKETILNTNKKSFPAVQDDIKKYVMKYYKKNVDDLRETVMEPYLKNGETYNSKLHYDLDVIEWEQGVNALAEDNLEAWIVSHVWTFIVDMALKDIEETKIGKEILAGEVARTGGIHDKKYLGDRMKLLKLMKDMFDTIIESLPPTTIKNYECLCTFGIQLFSTVYIMDRPKGVISRLTKKAQLEAPIYIEGICELILSIITMLELKPDLKGCLSVKYHLLEVFFAEVSSGPFEPTSTSRKHEEDDYKKLILLSKDAYNFIRENYSSDDKNSKKNLKIIEEVCTNYASDEEHDQNLKENLSDHELTNEEQEDSSSDEDVDGSSGDLTDSSEELRK
ncbi:7489_t:CDS:10, partial [Racocetra fulgida]